MVYWTALSWHSTVCIYIYTLFICLCMIHIRRLLVYTPCRIPFPCVCLQCILSFFYLFEWAHFIQACRWYQGQVQCTYSFCQSVWTSVTRLFTNPFYHQKCRDIFWNSLYNLTGILHRKLLSHDAFDMQNHDNLQAKHQFTCHHLYVTDLRAGEMCHSWSDFIRSFECQRYWRSIVSETGIKGKDK